MGCRGKGVSNLLDCTGAPIASGAMVATCADLTDAIAAIPPVGGQALLDCLGVILPDGTQVATCAYVDDAIAAIPPDTNQALTDCLGALLPNGTQVATCTYVDDAIAAIPPDTNQALTDCLGALLPNGTQVATCTYVDDAIAAIPATPSQTLRDCSGVLLPADTEVLQCSDLDEAQTVTGNWVFSDIEAPTLPPGTTDAHVATTAFVEAALASAGVNLTNCSGAPLAFGQQVVTCAQLTQATAVQNWSTPTLSPGNSSTALASTEYVDDAVAASPGQALQDCLGALLPNDTQVLTCADLAGTITVTGAWNFTAATAVTQAPGDNTTSLASTAFVQQEILLSPGATLLDCTGTPLGPAEQIVTCAQLSIPTTVTGWSANTPPPGDNDLSIATTAFVQNEIASAGGSGGAVAFAKYSLASGLQRATGNVTLVSHTELGGVTELTVDFNVALGSDLIVSALFLRAVGAAASTVGTGYAVSQNGTGSQLVVSFATDAGRPPVTAVHLVVF